MAFRGRIAEIPVGQDGLIGVSVHPNVPPTRLIDCNNITLEEGMLRKEGGAEKYNATAISGDPEIYGGWDWWPSIATQRMIVWGSDGKLYKDSGAGTFATTLKSGLSTPSFTPFFVDGGKEVAANNAKLFILSGSNQVQVLSGDGATTANITTPAADWATSYPTCGCIHEGRFWGAGNSNDPHRVYYSTTSSHEDMTGAGSGSISVFPGEGERIMALISFKGLLIVMKAPFGIYVVDTTDVTVANWKASTRISKEIGICGPHAWCYIDDDVIFVERGGEINVLSAIQEFGNLGTQSLTTNLLMNNFFHQNINKAEIYRTYAVFYPDKRIAYFAMPGIGSNELNIRIILDMNAQAPRFLASQRDSVRSMWLRRNADLVRVPIAGDTSGFVWELDQESRSKDGSGYEGMFQIPHLDLSHVDPILATKRKNGMFLEAVVEPKGNWDLSVDILWDGEYTETINFDMGSTGVALGVFTLGTDRLGPDQILNRKKRISGGGRRFSIIGRNSGDGQDFSVSKFYLHYRIGDERQE